MGLKGFLLQPYHEITLYQNIAKAVNLCKQSIRLGYAIWSNERHRQANDGYMFLDDMLDSYKVLYAGCRRSVIKDVIRQCEGVFWVFGRKDGRATASFLGLDRVADNLGVENQGRAVLVEPHLLFNRKNLKRTLLEVSLMSRYGDGDDRAQVRMARETIEAITAIKPRTQRRWQRDACKTYNHSGERSIGRDGEEYSPRQLGNTYYFDHSFKHEGRTNKSGRGFVDTTVDNILYESDAIVDGKRVVVKRRTFYMNEAEAKKQAYNLWLTGEPDRLPVFLCKGQTQGGRDLWDRFMFNGSMFINVGSELILS